MSPANPATPFEQPQAAVFDPALVSSWRIRRPPQRLRGLPQPARQGTVRRRPGNGHAAGCDSRHQHHPGPDTGIGTYSLADFDRAVRHGVAPGGRRLYPAMPYPSYAKLSDDDIRAMYAFFMKGVQPANQPNIPSDIPWPLNMRWPIALWNGVFAPTATYAANPNQDALWNRGAYIVQGPGHCGSCHTPRGLAFNEKALDESGKPFLAGALLDGWYAPSLRQDPNSGLGRWSEPEIVQFLKTGRNKHAVVYGSMTEAFNNSTQFMADDDLAAIARYLKSLPGDPQRDGTPWQYVSRRACARTPRRPHLRDPLRLVPWRGRQGSARMDATAGRRHLGPGQGDGVSDQHHPQWLTARGRGWCAGCVSHAGVP